MKIMFNVYMNLKNVNKNKREPRWSVATVCGRRYTAAYIIIIFRIQWKNFFITPSIVTCLIC